MLTARVACSFAVISAIVAALVTCTDDASRSATAADSGARTGVITVGVCPEVAPKPGDGCALPEGTTCTFTVCGSAIARCTQGLWRFGANVETPACPVDFPITGTACPACFPADLSCAYGSTDCSALDASTNRSVAACPNGTWVIATFPCSDASAAESLPDGGEAGADVQGDGGPG